MLIALWKFPQSYIRNFLENQIETFARNLFSDTCVNAHSIQMCFKTREIKLQFLLYVSHPIGIMTTQLI
jgi:hypothetical protein